MNGFFDKIRRKEIGFLSTSALMTKRLKILLTIWHTNKHIQYIPNIVESPFAPMDLVPKTICNKGNGIYFYTPALSTIDQYGYTRLKKIMKTHFPGVPLINACYSNNTCPPTFTHSFTSNQNDIFIKYSQDELDKIYNKCFIAIRLLQNDGLSNTVQQLGIKGIKTIWNGGTPSALPYKSDEDIINHIKNEMNTIGKIDKDLSDEVIKFLDPVNNQYIFNINNYLQKEDIIVYTNVLE
jgi:hypothetical protein